MNKEDESIFFELILSTGIIFLLGTIPYYGIPGLTIFHILWMVFVSLTCILMAYYITVIKYDAKGSEGVQ